MIELCKINRLKIVRDMPQGVYLGEADASTSSASTKTSSASTKTSSASTKTSSASTKTSSESTKTSSEYAEPVEAYKVKKIAAKFTGSREDVLLPRSEVPEGIKVGDELDVFIYLDSSDRYTATLKFPKICLGVPALLKVVQVTKIGIFLDWGLAKNLLLPFKEVVRPLFYDPIGSLRQAGEIEASQGTQAPLSDVELAWLEGRELPVVLYIDKSGRPAATMRVYDKLTVGEKYSKDSAVEFYVVQINPQLGVFVAVDDKYYGMISINEITDTINVGDRLFGRISGIRDDGKYMVSLTQKAHLQMDNDAQAILKRIRAAGGELALGDKSDAKDIVMELGMSKKAFKRAVGQLYKEGKVIPGDYITKM